MHGPDHGIRVQRAPARTDMLVGAYQVDGALAQVIALGQNSLAIRDLIVVPGLLTLGQNPQRTGVVALAFEAGEGGLQLLARAGREFTVQQQREAVAQTFQQPLLLATGAHDRCIQAG